MKEEEEEEKEEEDDEKVENEEKGGTSVRRRGRLADEFLLIMYRQNCLEDCVFIGYSYLYKCTRL